MHAGHGLPAASSTSRRADDVHLVGVDLTPAPRSGAGVRSSSSYPTVKVPARVAVSADGPTSTVYVPGAIVQAWLAVS